MFMCFPNVWTSVVVKIVACDIQIQDSELYFLWYLISQRFTILMKIVLVAPLTTFDVEKKNNKK